MYIVTHDLLSKLMKNKYRQQRELTNIHQYLSVIIRDAVKLNNQKYNI